MRVWKVWLAKTAAGIGGALALLAPVGKCPVCLSAAGVAGATGLSVLSSKPWFLLAIGLLLLMGLWGTIASARTDHRWGAVWATAIGAFLLLGGRLLTDRTLLWAGAGMLLAALLLNLYWKRTLTGNECCSRTARSDAHKPSPERRK
jgi:hypothetical protein